MLKAASTSKKQQQAYVVINWATSKPTEDGNATSINLESSDAITFSTDSKGSIR